MVDVDVFRLRLARDRPGLLLTILQEELDQPRAFAVALTKILDEDEQS